MSRASIVDTRSRSLLLRSCNLIQLPAPLLLQGSLQVPVFIAKSWVLKSRYFLPAFGATGAPAHGVGASRHAVQDEQRHEKRVKHAR